MPVPIRSLALVTFVSLIAALLLAVPVATTADAQEVGDRVAGTDSLGTAIALSTRYFDAADTVVVARVDDYADGLAAGPLAASVDAPLLFTDTAGISDEVMAEIARLGAANAIIVGGTAAVSQAAEDQLVAAGVTVERLSGPNRFGTAIAIATRLVGDTPPTQVLFVEGENADPSLGWPDAVSASAYASNANSPILPVNATYVPDAIMEQWAAWPDATGTVIGGTAAVPAAIVDTLTGAATDGGLAQDGERVITRIGGDTRFDTSAEVFSTSVSETTTAPTTTFMIPGGNFNEGLATGPIAGGAGNSMLMVDSVSLPNSAASAELLEQQSDLIESAVYVGDVSVLSEETAQAVEIVLNGEPVEAAFCLTLLHHNDGESQLLGAPGNPLFGNLGRLVSLATQEQAQAAPAGCEASGIVTVSSGDNFLAGPEFNASLSRPEGEPIYDALGLAELNYDAIDIGNHDFDFGPDVLERFITSFPDGSRPPYLSSNLDFSGEPGLQALVDAGEIAPSTVVSKDGIDVGIIGLTTPTLNIISSPRNVVVNNDIVGAVSTQVTALTDMGVEHIILISHLQGLQEDIDFIGQISGIDAVVAGGGDDVLASLGDPLVPGDLANRAGAYPLLLTDADGNSVPTVTTAGDYKYLGRLDLLFNADGTLQTERPFVESTSRMTRVADETYFDGVAVDESVQANALDPVQAFVDSLGETIIATSEVGLDGSRPNIRQAETNLGDLMADSLRNTVVSVGGDFGLTIDPNLVVGIQNGGGIRNNSVIPAGDISVLTTFDIAPFSNFVVGIPDVTPAQLKATLERAYNAVEFAAGSFGHVANLIVEVDASQQAQQIDDDTSEITTAGERVRSVTLTDGTPLITDGAVVDGAPNVTLATIDFLANGGDGYPLSGITYTALGTTYQQALQDQIVGPLAGTITSAAYPEGGEGRITVSGITQ